jgi:peptide deformylase
MVKIVDRDNPILRRKAKPVLPKDIKSSKIKKIIHDMKTALDGEDDGVAIAAPQIGAPLRIFVISPKVFDIISSEKEGKKKPLARHIVCINPSIIKSSREKMIVEEGCLSVRYLYGNVKRAEKVRLRATDEKGKIFEIGGSGLLAQIFQHETDHLEGILFTDKATGVHDMPPENISGPREFKKHD